MVFTLCFELFWSGIPKNVSTILTLSAIDGQLAANIVEQNIGQYLSEPEFHAESNNGGLIPPNWAEEPIFSLEVS